MSRVGSTLNHSITLITLCRLSTIYSMIYPHHYDKTQLINLTTNDNGYANKGCRPTRMPNLTYLRQQ